MALTKGDRNAAMLLCRILFWWPQAKTRFGGQRWIAKSAAEWQAETLLSRGQYERAIAKLRQLGLVVTEQHLHNDRAITFLRLTAKGEAVSDA
jgi:DNA-binding MarR family transcriptional regulator